MDFILNENKTHTIFQYKYETKNSIRICKEPIQYHNYTTCMMNHLKKHKINFDDNDNNEEQNKETLDT